MPFPSKLLSKRWSSFKGAGQLPENHDLVYALNRKRFEKEKREGRLIEMIKRYPKIDD